MEPVLVATFVLRVFRGCILASEYSLPITHRDMPFMSKPKAHQKGVSRLHISLVFTFPHSLVRLCRVQSSGPMRGVCREGVSRLHTSPQTHPPSTTASHSAPQQHLVMTIRLPRTSIGVSRLHFSFGSPHPHVIECTGRSKQVEITRTSSLRGDERVSRLQD